MSSKSIKAMNETSKPCEHEINGLCNKTVHRTYGPWLCNGRAECIFSTTMEAKNMEKQMTQEELDKWVEEKREEFRKDFDLLKKAS